jgi:Lrp/AsnC family leucine-responsive transcriptional regulator
MGITLEIYLLDNSSPKLDVIDRKILHTLQRHAKISNVELAKRVALTPTPCFDRVRRLEEAGYIEGYVAQLNPQKLGMGLLAFIEINLDRTDPTAFDELRRQVEHLPFVLECHMIAGGFDYLLKVRVADMAAFRKVLGEQISTLPGVSRTHTYFVMEEVKRTQELPIPGMKTK